GVFDSVDDPAVSGPLLDMACRWLASRGATRVEGPYFFNIHEEVGLMTKGLEHPSAILMPYNPLYYADLLLKAGFESIRRFVTYRYDLETSFEVVINRNRAIGKYAIRSFNMKDVRGEVGRLIEVYNSAFSDNWGFQPLTPEEGHALIGNLLEIGDPALVRIAEHDERAVGFILCVPDVNSYMHSIRKYPGFLKKAALVFAVMRSKIQDCRVITLAVRKEFQGRALSSLLIESLASEARKKGYRNAELSYVDTENRQMRRLMSAYDFHSQKEYQLFAKELERE
ncbi:MAG: GNAT family N-acetyltransferase, partial [Candidatus Wallbacteria bacterium]|nr:GNAT family N-acetyltransferase [Candidatus Wallbacteria bacterium]